MIFDASNPRKRFKLEFARFGLYIMIPVVATAVYSSPQMMQRILKSFKFVEYPPEGEKPPSAKDIMRLMDEREEKRAREKQVELIAGSGIVGGQDGGDTVLAKVQQGQVTGTKAGPAIVSVEGEVKQGRRWFGWFRRGGG
ncbi:unnamed protein product [Choristocarpus tenellus]